MQKVGSTVVSLKMDDRFQEEKAIFLEANKKLCKYVLPVSVYVIMYQTCSDNHVLTGA